MQLRTVVWAMLLLLAVGATASDWRSRETVLFIVSSRRDVRDLSSADLRRIFLGQISRWKDGRRIILFLRPADSPEGRPFLDRVVQMSDIDYSQHWIGAVFRGEAARAPRVIGSRELMIKLVGENDDAIGFVWSATVATNSIIVLTIDGKVPSDPAYPIGH
jgi:ABC-type phosphate transport system substrate-binding protein